MADAVSLQRRYLTAFDTGEMESHVSDVLVVGSGIAGLVAALSAADRGLTVDLVTKATVTETNTWYAQGGIAGAVGDADSVELHLADTLVVGQGLCEEDVVRAVVGEAPEALRALQARGVLFDLAEGGEVALAREGGHSLPRVLHSGDSTGAAIQNTLSAAVRRHTGIHISEEHFLVDLLTEDGRCIGALTRDLVTGGTEVFRASAVVLATGGCGQMYRVTTNPLVATGDGVAAAWRAGAELADMEFVQFHPTALDSASSPKFLITEALRGEGAYLLDCEGQRFMLGVHPLAELAPRDVVSREIEAVMERCARPNVWLDARHLGADYLRLRFPTIWETCLEAGYDISADLIPVAPAAHYAIGGVRVDIDGRTSLPGLWASGECAATGLHGANRLASNSLLEGLVFSRRIARLLSEDLVAPPKPHLIAERSDASELGEGEVRAARARLQDLMSREVGVRRTEEGLRAAEDELDRMDGLLDAELSTLEGFELQNLLTLATLTTRAARLRRETRGAHARADFPDRHDSHWRMHIVWKAGVTRLEPVAGTLEPMIAGEEPV